MQFGNNYAHQHKGIAMGMAPAPLITNLFVVIYEEAHIESCVLNAHAYIYSLPAFLTLAV